MGKKRIAVVFDFDGTLIDSRNIKKKNYVKAFEEIFNTGEANREIIEESFERTAGASRFFQLSHTLSALNIQAKDEEKQRWSNVYSSINKKELKQLSEFPSVRKVLDQLGKNGYELFLTSGVPYEELIHEIEIRGLREYFKEINGGGKSKFLKEIKRKGFDHILLIGDTDYDKKTAEDAGALFYKVESDKEISALPDFLLFLSK